MTGLRVIALEEQVLARTPAISAIHRGAIEGGRAEVAALVARSERGDLDHFETALAEAQRRTLVEYAMAVAGKVAPADVERWTELVAALPASRQAALPTAAPGALGILDAMEAAPDLVPTPADPSVAFAAIADRCSCGYASTRVLPRKRTCMICTMTVLDLWEAEERRLLGRAPAARVAVYEALDGAVGEIAKVRHRGDPETRLDVESSVRSRFGRRLRRANKEQRSAIALLDLGHWGDFAEAAAHGTMTAPQHDARRARRWGLGTARLCALARLGNAEIDDWAKKHLFTSS